MIHNLPPQDSPSSDCNRLNESHFSENQSQALRSEAVQSLLSAASAASQRLYSPISVENYDILRPVLFDQPEYDMSRLAEINRLFDHSGSMSRQEVSGYFPEQANSYYQAGQEATALSAVTDMLAYMNNPDRLRPYDTIRSSENGYAVGRYGLTAEIIMDWLSSLPESASRLGNPQDMSKVPALMAELARTGKIPADFAGEFKDRTFTQGFRQFLQRMQAGNCALSSAEIEKYFPKGMQEAVMMGIAQNAGQNGLDAASLALAMQLGKPTSKLSEADLSHQLNREYMYGSLEVLGFALAKQEAGPSDRIAWHKSSRSHTDTEHNPDSAKCVAGKDAGNGTSSELAFSIARAAENNARHTDTIGWCYRGVARTLDRFGIHLYGGSAYEAAPQLARNEHFKEVSPAHLKKGSILVFGPSSGHRHGHITVYLGNGMEASDHVQGLVNFHKYSSVRAFEPTA